MLPHHAPSIREPIFQTTHQGLKIPKTMEKKGIFTFTTGEPIRLKGFSDGAAVSWSQEEDVREQIKNEIESMFDVFCDGTYPYEDYYKYVETGFSQGITDAETLNETAAN